MALLDYRNTPQQGQEHSPAQRLLSRRTRGILPMMPSLLQPTVVHSGILEPSKLRLRDVVPKQNITTIEIWEVSTVQFSQESGYMQNQWPILSTSIQPGPMAW